MGGSGQGGGRQGGLNGCMTLLKNSIKTNSYITLSLWCVCVGVVLTSAQAQPYPTRPVRTIVPLAAGGSMDTIARGVSAKLSEGFGQTFVVDNRPGAGALIALDILSAAAPDGHTLMLIGGTTVVYPILYSSRYDMRRDVAPVSQVTAQGYVMVIHRPHQRGAPACAGRDHAQARAGGAAPADLQRGRH